MCVVTFDVLPFDVLLQVTDFTPCGITFVNVRVVTTIAVMMLVAFLSLMGKYL